jgi:hypothetical protein
MLHDNSPLLAVCVMSRNAVCGAEDRACLSCNGQYDSHQFGFSRELIHFDKMHHWNSIGGRQKARMWGDRNIQYATGYVHVKDWNVIYTSSRCIHNYILQGGDNEYSIGKMCSLKKKRTTAQKMPILCAHSAPWHTTEILIKKKRKRVSRSRNDHASVSTQA